MKLFHISDVLSVTTGRLVSSRHMEGVYDILNFMTGDNLFTHQLPRVMNEVKPWLAAQYPALMQSAPGMRFWLTELDRRLKRSTNIAIWVKDLRLANALPEMLFVEKLGAEMHTHIDPIEELKAMVGDDKVRVIRAGH